jgi:SAM-dependent methyltransferase
MSVEFPSAWAQVCPRSIRLSPEGLLVPASTLRVLLSRQTRLQLLVTGFGMEPALRDGLSVTVESGRQPRVGDLVLCDMGGWGDLLRFRRRGRGGLELTLDAFPRRPAVVPLEGVIGVVTGAEGRRGRAPARRLVMTLGLAALRFEWRRIQQAPRFGARASRSVGDKYRDQVAGYLAMRASNLEATHIEALRRHASSAPTILVAGCGAGGEVAHLARLGWRVCAFDLLPEMIAAARVMTAEAGGNVELFVDDVRTIDLPGRRFDAIYLTPLLYSFVAGRKTRVGMLSRLRRHLAPGGAVLFSVQLRRTPRERTQTALAFLRRRALGDRGVERGDWYTWYLTRTGAVGYSFLHRFSAGEPEAEARSAGFGRIERIDAHYLLTDPRRP